MNNDKATAFTLIELLVVIAIIAILAAILLPAMNAAFRKAEKAQAQTEIRSIETAVKAYYNEYSRYPNGNGLAADFQYGALSGDDVNNRQLMNTLRSINAQGNVDYSNNMRRIAFLEVSESSLSTVGDFIDPWTNQYEITVDSGFDNNCNNVPIYNAVTNKSVVVWSQGPDGEEGNNDDVKSW